ncbi:MAG: aldo/keto reductase [Desulfobacteraceae bacterium]|nr:aldo/keto reductase [Desulfobacteraceae bacterium]
MNFLNLGSTDIKISKIIMGTWQAGKQMWTGIEDSDSIEAIKTAYENNITTFDTAEMYGKGHSERILGQALKSVRNKVVIATKAAPQNLSKDKLISACEKSLKNLDTDYIDLYQIHWPAGSFGSKKIPVSETLEAMDKLKKQGKIRAVGVSNFSREQLEEALNCYQIDSVQPPYSILWRHIEKDLTPLCFEKNITVLSYSPMAQGLLTGRFKKGHKFEKGDNRASNKLFQGETFEKALEIIEELKPIASDLGISLSNLALSWVKSKKNTAAIAGARNKNQSKENAKALNTNLSAELVEFIDKKTLEFTNITGESPVMWG